MNKFTFSRQYNYYIASHENFDYAEIYKKYNGTWVLVNHSEKDLGYTLRRYFNTYEDAKNYLNSKFNELVYLRAFKSF